MINYICDTISEDDIKKRTSSDYIEMFLAAKHIEGCSEKTLRVYERSIRKLVEKCDKLVTQITTEDIRTYLGNYQAENDYSKVTMDNERR